MVTLPDSAVVPAGNVVKPPARLTHEVVAPQPYYYSDPGPSTKPDGAFPAGAKVALMDAGTGAHRRVVDSQGLSVMTAFAGLRPLGSGSSPT